MAGAVTLGIVYGNESRNGYHKTRVLELTLLVQGGALTCRTGRQVGGGSGDPVYGHGAQYVNEEFTVLGQAAGEDQTFLFPAGKHKIQFSFQLPDKLLVTSFTGKYGKIYYQTITVLKRPSVPTLTSHRELHIISPINVNAPSLYTPVQRFKEIMVGCWFFASGPVSVNAKIGRKGYCNGEAIQIYADIENGSSRLVVPKAGIYQTQSFILNGKTRTVRQMLASVRGNHVASGSSDTWNGKTLKVPPVTPSILDCNIFRVEYSLVVSVNIPGSKKLKVELPIVIGTIPLTPPNYAYVVSEEELSRDISTFTEIGGLIEGFEYPPFAVIQEFRFQPPPLYSEEDPHPPSIDGQNVPFTLEN
ncbi:hypothetical protein GDO86_006449 [Hymenochirus boettgeri]|uniref:Arrestin C-terminal-like domain-containing protein n=1 Tax=Hymenochirus boettgeri TaxID=247094 RepID=A0A8T2JAI1_9PIPI|nr:hypothetical protein GDO86_006449 [Hymenochirus boettgeri]